jgi:hypothetical protein
MDCLSNEADSMPPSGHPIREVRPTPWVPIQEPSTECQHPYRAKTYPALTDKSYLSRRVTAFVPSNTLGSIKYLYLHGL